MGNPNRSTAVMQRRAEPHDSLDYFPTPPWAARALCEFLRGELREDLAVQTCWEPATGEQHLARGLKDYFATVDQSDIHPFAEGDDQVGVHDFLLGPSPFQRPDWIITNPPFRLGEQFIIHALNQASRGVAMFVRSAFTESEGRYRRLFADDRHPPAFVLQFVERVVLLKNRLIQANASDPFNLDDEGKPKKASSATSYCWLVWLTDDRWTAEDAGDTRHRWLGTPRVQLERPGDYPDYAEQWGDLKAAPHGGLL